MRFDLFRELVVDAAIFYLVPHAMFQASLNKTILVFCFYGTLLVGANLFLSRQQRRVVLSKRSTTLTKILIHLNLLGVSFLFLLKPLLGLLFVLAVTLLSLVMLVLYFTKWRFEVSE